MIRQDWIGEHAHISQMRQCKLAGVVRSTVYARRKEVEFDPDGMVFMRLIDEEYTRHPFYGSRKMVVHLFRCGHQVNNRKRVQGLMRTMGLAGMAPGPNTSKAHPVHKIYPYFLRGVAVGRRLWRNTKPKPNSRLRYAPAGLRSRKSGLRVIQQCKLQKPGQRRPAA